MIKKNIRINRKLHNCHSIPSAKGKRKLNQSKGIRSTGSRDRGEIFHGMVRVGWLDSSILNRLRRGAEASQVGIWSKSAVVRGDSSATESLL